MNERNLTSHRGDKYEIRKIILADGTELDINKITHVALIKESRKKDNINFKITFCCSEKDELITMSNECNMLAFAFKFMAERNISFDAACAMYDLMLKEAREFNRKNI